MHDRSFDKLVRDFGVSVLSRRSLGLAIPGVALSLLKPQTPDTEAARRRRSHRGKRKNDSGRKNRNSKDHGQGSGKGSNDCQKPETCPSDVFSLQAGRVCEDNRCSCGGVCCDKGFACFIDTDMKTELCCFDDPGVPPFPEDTKYAVCIPDRSVCCTVEDCKAGTCEPPDETISPSRYRRNPR